MANVRAKKRETPSKSHAITIAHEARARGMKDVHLYRKHGLFGTKYIVTYLDESRGEKVKKGLKGAGGHAKRASAGSSTGRRRTRGGVESERRWQTLERRSGRRRASPTR